MHFLLLDRDTRTNVVCINGKIADDAAKIRSEYQGFKAMDALQLASAMSAGCDLFLTNDKQLGQYSGLRIMTMGEIEEGES